MEDLNIDPEKRKNGDAETEKEEDKEDGGQNSSAQGEVDFCLSCQLTLISSIFVTIRKLIPRDRHLEGKGSEEDDEKSRDSESDYHVVRSVQHARLIQTLSTITCFC